MHLLRKHAARFPVLFLFAALLLAVCSCHHDTGNCIVAPAPGSGPGPAGAGPSFGRASNFEILASSTVTNTGLTTTIFGDVGVSTAGAGTITGMPAGQPTGGSAHEGDAAAMNAQTDVTVVYNDLVARPCTVTLTGADLGGLTLPGGVYCFASTAGLTGTLTLDGNANTVFVFKIGSGLTTASNSAVVMTGGALAKNVFWQVTSSAVLGTNTAFQGNIVALSSVTLDTGTSITGRALARTGAVTMDNNAATLP